MNAYERERAECTADEEARADRRLRAWQRRHTTMLAARPARPGAVILDFSAITNIALVTR